MISNQLFIEFKTELLKIKDKNKLERVYYEKLTKCLKARQFKAFELLFNASVDFNLFIDIKKIPNRFDIISKLLLNSIDKISTGYQTSALGEILDTLRFCNEYNFLERDISNLEKYSLRNLKKDTLFLANLNDLFGKVSNSFILYVYKVMPQELYEFFIKSPISFIPDRDGLMHYIKNIFFNQYSIYGLSVRNISPIDNFIKVFKENYPFNESQFKKHEEELTNKVKELLEFDVLYRYRTFYYDTEEEHENQEIKKHLVSPNNIIKNLSKVLKKNNYKFYNLSMVLHGGLGPQGLGFTYSTPKGEVIEICSDTRQNKAIIIKFKKFLKTQFIEKLGKEMTNLHIKEITIEKVVNYLIDALDKKELISYFEKESVLRNIKNFLLEDGEYHKFSANNLKRVENKITSAIHAILRPIKMMDQYKARMDLVARGLLKSEDIAKLTSLKEKSHYDILRERFFFQYITNWFYEIYETEKLKNENKNNVNKYERNDKKQ